MVPWCFGCTSGLQLLSSQTLGTLFKMSLFYFLSLLSQLLSGIPAPKDFPGDAVGSNDW